MAWTWMNGMDDGTWVRWISGNSKCDLTCWRAPGHLNDELLIAFVEPETTVCLSTLGSGSERKWRSHWIKNRIFLLFFVVFVMWSFSVFVTALAFLGTLTRSTPILQQQVSSINQSYPS
jgi:hypothetical protein